MKATLGTTVTAAAVAMSASTSLAAQSMIPTLHLPLNFRYGPNHKVSTDLYSASTNTTIEVVVDSGSENFFLFGPDSIDNWGARCIACQGPCNASVPTGSYFDYPNSATATARDNFTATYVYGGADKIYTGSYAVNDTFAFTNEAGVSADTPDDVRVAIMNFLSQRVEDATCANPPLYDLGILGISPYYTPVNGTGRQTVGPSFRQDLLQRKVIHAAVQSMWFDQPPTHSNGTFTGAALFGGIDTSKYSGDLVKVVNRAQSGQVGYFVAPPTVSVAGVSYSGTDDTTTTTTDATLQCQLDSGTHDDDIPIGPGLEPAFFNATGITRSPTGYVSWPGSCDSIPANRTIDLTFPGATLGESVTIHVPIRSYVRLHSVESDAAAGYCLLSLSTSEPGSGCMLGAPFSTAAFFATDDERAEVALAQGGVSKAASGIHHASVVGRIP